MMSYQYDWPMDIVIEGWQRSFKRARATRGGVCTIHANSARNAVDAMVLRAQAAGMGGSAEMIQRYATQFLEAIAHIRHNEHNGDYEVALELLKPFTIEEAAA